jgi:hypothetical protein
MYAYLDSLQSRFLNYLPVARRAICFLIAIGVTLCLIPRDAFGLSTGFDSLREGPYGQVLRPASGVPRRRRGRLHAR